MITMREDGDFLRTEAPDSEKRPFKVAFYFDLDPNEAADVAAYIRETVVPSVASLLGRWVRVRFLHSWDSLCHTHQPIDVVRLWVQVGCIVLGDRFPLTACLPSSAHYLAMPNCPDQAAIVGVLLPGQGSSQLSMRGATLEGSTCLLYEVPFIQVAAVLST